MASGYKISFQLGEPHSQEDFKSLEINGFQEDTLVSECLGNDLESKHGFSRLSHRSITEPAPDQNTPHQRTNTSSGLATRLALSRCSVYRTLQTWPIFGKFSDTFLVRSGRTPTRRASTLSMQCSIYSSHPKPPFPTIHLSLAGSNWTKHQSEF
ncbi:hypothetical protein RRG08_065139 [Elysia crispata]|uniref:Uncharacterized protein n=1 Tax=Elysia crispata TaxID=231223 RepID=A0AAE0Z9L6_9GAST|nr:hypothetical protein RRG08_065139 [Elysia crispata]